MATIKVNTKEKHSISPFLYMQFMEPLGSCDSSVDAALSIIDRLHEDGFRFVTVSQLAALRGVTPQPGKIYTNFPAP